MIQKVDLDAAYESLKYIDRYARFARADIEGNGGRFPGADVELLLNHIRAVYVMAQAEAAFTIEMAAEDIKAILSSLKESPRA